MALMKDRIYTILLSILCIVCFPANPLVLTGILDVESYLPLFVIGCFVWAFGMALVMAPIIIFPKRGSVPKGKSFVHTTRLVDTGIYSMIRHPQYTGGIYSIFITTLLWYPHWLFAILGALGILVIYLSTIEEDKRLIKKFGSDYLNYADKVPKMNIFIGIIRVLQSRKE